MQELFNNMAPTWDKDPAKVERARLAAQIMVDNIPINGMTTMEYGCGTGLLSFFLQSKLKHVDLMDNSPEMKKVLQGKIKENGISNMSVVDIDLASHTEEQLKEKYNLVYTLMTLHHINDINTFLNNLNQTIKPKGYLGIFDLVTEDGSFHLGQPFDGYNGFDKDNLEELLKVNGFKTVLYKSCYFKVQKTFEDETKREYPLFALIAQK